MSKIFDNVLVKYTLDAEVYTTDTDATDYVDTLGFSDGMLLVAAGDIATTTGDVYTVTVWECDTTNGTYATTGIAVTFQNTDDNELRTARIANLNTTRMRYLKAKLTMTGTTLSWEGAAMILLGEGDSGPVTQDS
jgi:hypothetical protein